MDLRTTVEGQGVEGPRVEGPGVSSSGRGLVAPSATGIVEPPPPPTAPASGPVRFPLRAKLAAQGLFDEGRRRPIPRHPAVIGVITSPDAAA